MRGLDKFVAERKEAFRTKAAAYRRAPSYASRCLRASARHMLRAAHMERQMYDEGERPPWLCEMVRRLESE